MTDDLGTFAKALILVVDDDVTQRLITRDTLEQEDFRVEEASNGEYGLELVRKLHPDLVLLDVMMPGIDGFEVCRRLRSEPPIRHIPVIIVTGREDTEDIQKGFAAGATDFLTKPVVWNLLSNRIRYVLRTSKLESDIRTAKEIAEKSNEAKTALLSTMGHELRTPLNAIIGFSELIRQEVYGPIVSPQYEEYVANIHTSANLLLETINAILEMVSCESGKLEHREQDFKAVDFVESVMKRISPVARESGIDLVSEFLNNRVCILGDEQRLEHALLKLVSNAIKFSKPGGTVRLNMVLAENGDLVIATSDDGIGISAEDLPKIMEPFVQADTRLARRFEGLGLGLPLARAILRLHDGAIELESQLGLGTTARITLPSCRVRVLSESESQDPTG